MIATVLLVSPVTYGAVEKDDSTVSQTEQKKAEDSTTQQKTEQDKKNGNNDDTQEKLEEGKGVNDQKLEQKAVEENGEEDNRRVVTLDEAVSYALEHSIALQQVKTKADIAKLVSDNSEDTKKDLTDADEQLNSAPYQLDRAQDTITLGESQLESARALFGQGKMPVNYSFGGVNFVQGDDIDTKATAIASAMHVPKEVIVNKINDAINEQLLQNSNQLEAGKSEYQSKTREYYNSSAKFQSALSYAMSNVSSKLCTSTISSLDPKPIGELIIKMADTQNQVTSYSVNIYKNKIGLLVQNSYYEALKQQKLLEVKEKAVERGKKQYELAEAAYQIGAKSKDDMIIAKTYYDSTIMSAELQMKDYNAALIELKKNMNMDMGEEIKVEEVALSPQEKFDLKQGLISGKRARLEIKMAQAHIDLYKYLKTALTDSSYSTESNQYREASLLQQEAEIELKSAEQQVESDIRTSYSTMTSMQKIAEKSLELKKGAEETLEIAKVKYEVGFGYDNALLTSMNLESMSGTMVEVLAAEENLVNIEEKAIEAMDGYNLSRLKYLNDIGVLPY